MLFIHVLPNKKYQKYILVNLAEHFGLQKDAEETAKLFRMLLRNKISYEVVKQIPVASKEQVLHLIGIPDEVDVNSNELLLQTAAHMRDLGLLELEIGKYLYGEIKSGNIFINPYDLHQLVAPHGYTNSDVDELFAEDVDVEVVQSSHATQVVQLLSMTIPEWVTLHYVDADVIQRTGLQQCYLVVEAKAGLTFVELMSQSLANTIPKENVFLISSPDCLMLLQAREATSQHQHIIPVDAELGIHAAMDHREILLKVTHYFQTCEFDEAKELKSRMQNWRQTAAYARAVELSNVLLQHEYPVAILDRLLDFIFGSLIYDGRINERTTNKIFDDMETLNRQKKFITLIESIFAGSKIKVIEYINQKFLEFFNRVAIRYNYQASIPNIYFRVSNGPHVEWQLEGLQRFQAVTQSCQFIMQAGFNELYASECSGKKAYLTADWADYVAFLRGENNDVSLLKTVGRFILYKATIGQKEQWIMTAAIEDNIAYQFAKRDENGVCDFTQVIDCFTRAELQLLWNYAGGMVEKSENETVDFLAHCHAGRNRSPVLLAIIYFACLLQQKIKQKLSKEEIVAQLGKPGQTLAEKLTNELEKLRDSVGPVDYQFVRDSWEVQLKRIWQDFIENMEEFSAVNKKENIFKIAKPDEFTVKTDKLLSVLHDYLASQVEALGGFGILKMFGLAGNACADFFEELHNFNDADYACSGQQAALARYLILADAKKQVRQASDIKQLDKIVGKLLQNPFLQSLHPMLKEFVVVTKDAASVPVSALANSLIAAINRVAAVRAEVADLDANAAVGTLLKLN